MTGTSWLGFWPPSGIPVEDFEQKDGVFSLEAAWMVGWQSLEGRGTLRSPKLRPLLGCEWDKEAQMVGRALRQGLERRLGENGWSGKPEDLSSVPAAH